MFTQSIDQNIDNTSTSDLIVSNEVVEQSTYKKLLTFMSTHVQNPKVHALPIAIEATVGFIYASAATQFASKDTEWYLDPFAITSYMVLLNLLSRSIKLHESWKKAFTINRLTRGIIFSLMDLASRATLLHEGGHALALLALYKDPDPKITLLPGFGGFTVFGNDKAVLNELGIRLGSKTSRAIISAAGAGTEHLYDLGALIAAQAIPNHYPEIKSHLRCTSIMSILAAAIYALSALIFTCSSDENDFCKLKSNGGIEPYVAVCFIVGSALFLQLFLSCLSSRCKKKENQEPEVQEIIEHNSLLTTENNNTQATILHGQPDPEVATDVEYEAEFKDTEDGEDHEKLTSYKRQLN